MDADSPVADFVAAAHEDLDRLERDCVALERHPGSTRLLTQLLAVASTLRAGSDDHGLSALHAVCLGVERLLAAARAGSPVTTELIDALLTAGDTCRAILDHLQSGDGEPLAEHVDVEATVALLQVLLPVAEQPPLATLGEVLIDHGVVTPAAVSFARHAQEAGDVRPLGEILVSHGSLTSDQLAGALDDQHERRSVPDHNAWVDAGLLDELTALADDVGAHCEEVGRRLGPSADGAIQDACRRLADSVRELQGGVRRTRLRRFDTILDRLPRVVRDRAAAGAKLVRLEVHGGELLLDRALLDVLRGPLVALVRNAVEHGIETPVRRSAVDKAGVGTVMVRVSLLPGAVGVEVTDDGAGIDPLAMAAAALSRGAVPAYELARLADADVLRLALRPGTGTGLDGVYDAVESVAGTVDVVSEPGTGTTVRLAMALALPATAATRRVDWADWT